MSTGSFVGVLGVASDDSAESSEVVVEEQVDPAVLKIREERKLAKAVRDYLDAKEVFEEASMGLQKICDDLRGIVAPDTVVVVSGGYGKYHGKNFLLTSEKDIVRGFDVKPVEVI